MRTPGFVPLAQAAGTMGLCIEEAVRYSVVVGGETVIAESVMRSVAAERNRAAQAEQKEYVSGTLEAHERKY